jgi:N-acetylglucosamine-6-phosphate deacetylase
MEDSGGNLRILTLAPELEGAEDLIRECLAMGIIPAIGHTGAGKEHIRMAVDAGARLSTHLGNGAHRTLPRHPNYIWDQLAEDRLYASMIADGFHLPESVLKVFFRSKGDRAILVSDGMPQTGLEPGLYDTPAAGKIRLTEEGKLHKSGNPALLAGSASTLLKNVEKVSRMEGFSRAWDMGSIHPSHLLNRSANHGLKVGAPADLALLDPKLGKLKVLSVLKGGVEKRSLKSKD